MFTCYCSIPWGRTATGIYLLPLWVWGFLASSPVVLAQTPPEVAAPAEITDEDASLSQIRTQSPDVQSAVTLFLQGDIGGAESQMKRAKEKHPELPPVGVMMAKLYLNARNPAAARNELEKAVRDDPNDPEPYVVFGNSALQQRAFTDAILLFQQALTAADAYTKNNERKKNLTIRAQSGIATVAEAREDWSEAEKALRALLQADPDNVAALQRLGHVLFQQKREQDAYTVFQDAYRIDKENVARPEVNMARRYQAAGDDARAAKLMQTAKERDPEGLPTRLAIAQWALETNRLEEAKENAKVASQLDPDNFQVYLLDGVLARIDGEYPRAEEAFRAAHLLAPTNGVVLNQLAIALVSQDDQAKKELAFQYAQMASKLFGDPKTVLGRETLVVFGWVLSRLDQLSQAVAVVHNALSQGGIGEDSAYFAAEIFQQAGRSEPALQLLNRALDDNERLFPNRKAAMALRARILSSTNAASGNGTSN